MICLRETGFLKGSVCFVRAHMGNMVPCGPLWHKTSVRLMYCSLVGPHELTPTYTSYPSLTRISDRQAVRPTHFGVFQSWANTLGWPKFSAKGYIWAHIGYFWPIWAYVGPGRTHKVCETILKNTFFLNKHYSNTESYKDERTHTKHTSAFSPKPISFFRGRGKKQSRK